MAAKNTFGTILTWGAIGVGAWWLYETYFSGTAAAGGTSGGNAGGNGTGSSAGSSAGSSGTSSSGTGSGSGGSAYTGPSLASIFGMFQAAVAAAYTPPEMASTPRPPGPVRTGNSPALLVVGQRPTGLRGLGDASISYTGGVYYANPDVFNYYLAQVLPSPPVSSPFGWPPDVTEVFPGFDRTQLMSITDYWSGMSGYLSSRMGMSGLGVFAGLGMIASANRGWPEIATKPWNGGEWPATQGWWNGGAGRAVQ